MSSECFGPVAYASSGWLKGKHKSAWIAPPLSLSQLPEMQEVEFTTYDTDFVVVLAAIHMLFLGALPNSFLPANCWILMFTPANMSQSH